jgi:hypothetical protein
LFGDEPTKDISIEDFFNEAEEADSNATGIGKMSNE